MFTRGKEPLGTLNIGKRYNLIPIATVKIQINKLKDGFIDEEGNWSGTCQCFGFRYLSMKQALDFFERAKDGTIGKKWVYHNTNIKREDIKKANIFDYDLRYAEEDIKNGGIGRAGGEFLYGPNNEIYNLPRRINFKDDLSWGSKFENFKSSINGF